MLSARQFVLYLGEMFLAMMIGMAALNAVFNGALAVAGTSYPALVDDRTGRRRVDPDVQHDSADAPVDAGPGTHGDRGLRDGRRHGRGRCDDRLPAVLSVINSAAICGVECGLMFPAMVAATLLHPSMQAMPAAGLAQA